MEMVALVECESPDRRRISWRSSQLPCEDRPGGTNRVIRAAESGQRIGIRTCWALSGADADLRAADASDFIDAAPLTPQ